MNQARPNSLKMEYFGFELFEYVMSEELLIYHLKREALNWLDFKLISEVHMQI